MTAMCVLTTAEGRNAIASQARPGMLIACGIGRAIVLRDGEVVANGDRLSRRDRRRFRVREYLSLRDVEKYVRRRRQGHRAWAVVIHAPLWSAAWARRGPRRWTCVATGRGFA